MFLIDAAMDLAKTLIRSVVRAFYDTPFILVIDALMVHSALHNEDLAHLLQMQNKELRKLCGKLKEDRLLSVHSRLEFREGQQRPINKDYYYVDFHATIDAIKYRIFRLTQKVKEMYKPSEEKKDFNCPRCKAQWTELEVLDNVGPIGFECHRCGGLLEREPDAGDSTGHAKQSRLMSQLEGLLKMLQQVDSEDIPNNDFDTAFSLAIPVPRDTKGNPVSQRVHSTAPQPPPAAVKGMVSELVAAQINVSVTTGSEKTSTEQAAEAQRKANIAAQNALPVWHTTSTVTGESAVIAKKDGEQQLNGGALHKEEEDERKISAEDEQLQAYYAEIERERENEAREREAASDDEDEGEDEGDFEDVFAASRNGTPSSSISGTPKGSQVSQLNGNGKRKDSESESSAPATNNSTPVASGQAIEEGDGPVTKRVKFENQEDGVSAIKSEAGERVDKDSDEDEEADFEDAL